MRFFQRCSEARFQAFCGCIVPCIFLQSALALDVTGSTRRSDNLAAISNARVTLFTPSLTFFSEQRTSSNGTYVFAQVPPGDYRLGAAALGFEYVEAGITITDEPGAVHDFALGLETHPGRWTIAGTTAPEMFDATDIAVLQADGKIFYCHDTMDPVLFDPVTGQKSFPAASPASQGCMSGTVMQDGRIIMVGGQTPEDPGSFRNAVRWVKTYTPSTNTWQWLPELQAPNGRWYPGLARLADASYLIMGGGTAPNATRTNTCERFNLANQTWSFTGNMLNPCEFPPSALLYTGEVLATWSPPQLYNVTTGQWRATGNFNQPNRGWPDHSDHSVIVLADGRILAIGIRKGPNNNSIMGEIYDPVSGTWSLTSNPGLVRLQTEVIQLPDGRVFVGGGETQAASPPVPTVLGIVKWCDLYDPSTNTWRRMGDMKWFREYHAVTVLVPDGRVLTTGGTRIKFTYGPISSDIEAFEPPCLFRGVRPQITSISNNQPFRGGRLTLTIAPQTRLTSVVLMGTLAHTHWVDGGINRRLVLPVQQLGSSAITYLPRDLNVLPLGHYMVFGMVDDIPSVAKIIRVTAGPTLIRADLDEDNDVDSDDFGLFQSCQTGPVLGPPASGPCLAADFDGDDDIDISDFGLFQRCLSGPNVAPSFNCDG